MKETLEGDPEAYYDSAELLEPLKLMYRSLMETHDDGIANGRLLDVIRQVRPAALIHLWLQLRTQTVMSASLTAAPIILVNSHGRNNAADKPKLQQL